MLSGILIGVQLFFSCVIGVYFLMQLKSQTTCKSNIHKDSTIKWEKIQALRRIALTPPLSEKIRPKCEQDILGQEDALQALKIALCGPSPQHILIYGAPGVGKTAAARIVLELAKRSKGTPFLRNAKFVEIDATTLRFDERSIADPLMGSVHDPIYQGAGAYGPAGIPQPKIGAVTKAHGGVLFIDEIGELHQVQMNKLLKVLEDRKVFLESSYYAESDENIPRDVHDIFKNGLPADFRLIGATTRSPEDIPPALRSRCTEIFFKDLSYQDIMAIVENVTTREQMSIEKEAKQIIGKYAQNGREAVNMLQTAFSLIQLEGRQEIIEKDLEWVVQTGRYIPRPMKKVVPTMKKGVVNGLGILGNNRGMVLELEAVAKKVEGEKGEIKVTGIIEEEELKMRQSNVKRKSMVSNSVENVLTVLKMRYNVTIEEYSVHINFASGIPMDGPSAGTAIFMALYSVLFDKEIPGDIAMTGEISLQGKVNPVGGVYEKLLAAKEAGVKCVFVPKANIQKVFGTIGIQVVPVEDIEEIVEALCEKETINRANNILHA